MNTSVPRLNDPFHSVGLCELCNQIRVSTMKRQDPGFIRWAVKQKNKQLGTHLGNSWVVWQVWTCNVYEGQTVNKWLCTCEKHVGTFSYWCSAFLTVPPLLSVAGFNHFNVVEFCRSRVVMPVLKVVFFNYQPWVNLFQFWLLLSHSTMCSKARIGNQKHSKIKL